MAVPPVAVLFSEKLDPSSFKLASDYLCLSMNESQDRLY